MGLFSSIKKAFKKVVKGVSKVIKKGVKAVKKVVKKISSSKVLRTLATIAAVVVTGGAALGAFPGLASTQIGSAIVNAGNWISSVPVLGKAFVPFSKAGAFAGEALYTAGAKLGFIKDIDVAAKTIQAAGGSSFATTKAALEAGTLTADTVLSQANAVVSGTGSFTAKNYFSPVGKFVEGEGYKTLTAEEIKKLGYTDLLAGTTATPATFLGEAGATAPMTSFGGKAAQLTGKAVGALASPIASIGKQIAVGYGTAKLLGAGEGPQTGEAFGFSNEQKSQLDSLMVAQSQTGVDISKAYDQTFNFGTGDVGYLNNSLYQSPVLQV